MKLQSILDQDYRLNAWMIKTDPRGESRLVVKMNKQTRRGEKCYVAHAPFKEGVNIADVEFTEPILLKWYC